MPLSASVVASYTDKAIDIWQQTATKNKHPDAPRPPDTFLNETLPSVNDDGGAPLPGGEWLLWASSSVLGLPSF